MSRLKSLRVIALTFVFVSAASAQEPQSPSTAPQSGTAPVASSGDSHDHTMQLPGGGPELKIRGFADFNLGLGSAANPLIFPLPAPVHSSFQAGEFDLYLSSRLAKKVSFLSEIVIGSDATNTWGLDLERLQVTYKASRLFEISGGRFHTAIGYYNTAFHHGTWFQTATGRPFMFYFEDSGGVLPVHSVGITATGAVPSSGALDMHWIAEVGNGTASDPANAPVQNFASDKNYKAFNLALYAKPQWAPGIQIGGSFYHDQIVPPLLPRVTQNLGSAYIVYINAGWEFLNEAVLMSNHAEGALETFHSPLAYSQISRKFGDFRPYFRYQYVNIPANDPGARFTGRYESPSVGLRMDFTEYAALKIQYNRLYQRSVSPQNGADLQVAFTF